MSRIVVFTTESTDGLQSVLDLRFGRAAAFVFVDVETGAVVNEWANSSVDAAHGAGIGAAAMIASQKVRAVVSGSFGPKAYSALSNLNIEMWMTSEKCSVQKAVELFQSGRLAPMTMKVYP